MDIGEIYKKYINGDAITDEELKFAIKTLIPVEKTLRDLGLIFHLAWVEVNTTLRVFEGFRDKRAEFTRNMKK